MNILKADYKKVTQVINFFARSSRGNTINKMKALKLVWAADRFHLRKYGRPIIGDKYLAMEWGPVASKAKDIIEDTIVLVDEEKEYRAKYIKKVDSLNLKSLQEVDKDLFSQTDLESMEFAIKSFGKMNEFDLSELTHKYPEWKKFKESLVSGSINCGDISYHDFFKDPDNIKDDKFKMDEKLLRESEDFFSESEKIRLLLQ